MMKAAATEYATVARKASTRETMPMVAVEPILIPAKSWPSRTIRAATSMMAGMKKMHFMIFSTLKINMQYKKYNTKLHTYLK